MPVFYHDSKKQFDILIDLLMILVYTRANRKRLGRGSMSQIKTVSIEQAVDSFLSSCKVEGKSYGIIECYTDKLKVCSGEP